MSILHSANFQNDALKILSLFFQACVAIYDSKVIHMGSDVQDSIIIVQHIQDSILSCTCKIFKNFIYKLMIDYVTFRSTSK